METKDYLRILKEEVHSTVIATVDRDGKPVTRVIDIMLADEDSLYFITANVPRNVSTCHPAGTLPALRELYGSMPVRGGGAKCAEKRSR